MRHIILNRPEQCPFRTIGCQGNLCGHPARTSPLYCDTAPSAIASDGFPLMCPLLSATTRYTEQEYIFERWLVETRKHTPYVSNTHMRMIHKFHAAGITDEMITTMNPIAVIRTLESKKGVLYSSSHRDTLKRSIHRYCDFMEAMNQEAK